MSSEQKAGVNNQERDNSSGSGTAVNNQMVKALKLFAKNHQELEKVSDPEKNAGNRRVLSYDSRTGNGNVPASTFEKCGGTIPSGPKFVNELVERELANYKAEVEIKFKDSVMNAEYVFLRTKVAVASKVTEAPPSLKIAKPNFYLNDFSKASKIAVEEVSNSI